MGRLLLQIWPSHPRGMGSWHGIPSSATPQRGAISFLRFDEPSERFYHFWHGLSLSSDSVVLPSRRGPWHRIPSTGSRHYDVERPPVDTLCAGIGIGTVVASLQLDKAMCRPSQTGTGFRFIFDRLPRPFWGRTAKSSRLQGNYCYQPFLDQSINQSIQNLRISLSIEFLIYLFLLLGIYIN